MSEKCSRAAGNPLRLLLWACAATLVLASSERLRSQPPETSRTQASAGLQVKAEPASAQEESTADPLLAIRTAAQIGSASWALTEIDALEPQARASAEVQHLRVLALLRLDRLDEAKSTADKLASQDPDSSSSLALKGRVALRLADLNGAGAAFYQAAQIEPPSSDAQLGLARLFLAERRRRSAVKYLRLALDQGASGFWSDLALELLTDEELEQLIPRMSDPKSWRLAFENRDSCRLASPRKTYDLKLRQFRPKPGRDDRLGFNTAVNDDKPQRTLLDTGASGITIAQSIAQRVGAKRIGSTQILGVGDEGARDAWLGVVERISVGNLEYRDCVVSVMDDEVFGDGEAQLIAGIDWLWNDFLVTMDVPQLRLVLTAHPAWHEADPKHQRQEPYERSNSSVPQGWAPVRLFGHDVIMPALIDNEIETYFLLDTGAWATVLSTRIGEQLGRLRASNVVIQGISGEVETVQEIHGDTVLLFPGVQQEHRNIKVIDLDRFGRRDSGFGGVIGYSLLQYMEVTIDGRRGLIRMVPGKVKRRPSR